MVAALSEEMKNARGSACLKNCEMGFRYSRCVRQGGRGGSSLVEKSCQVRIVESRKELDGQGMGDRVLKKKKMIHIDSVV